MKTSILVIDNNQETLDLIRNLLPDKKYHIKLATNCNDATNQLQDMIYDIIIANAETGDLVNFIKNMTFYSGDLRIPCILLTKNLDTLKIFEIEKFDTIDWIKFDDLNKNILERSIRHLYRINELNTIVENEKGMISEILTNIYENKFNQLRKNVEFILHEINEETLIRNKEALFESLSKLSFHDTITKLPNKKAFEKAFTRFNDTCERYNRKSALLLLELNLKNTNDEQAEVEDILIKECANALVSEVRNSDFLATIDKGIFAILLNTVRDELEASQAAERLCKLFQSDDVSEHIKNNIYLRIGIILFPTSILNVDEILTKAEFALKQVPKDGSGGFKQFRNLSDI